MLISPLDMDPLKLIHSENFNVHMYTVPYTVVVKSFSLY